MLSQPTHTLSLLHLRRNVTGKFPEKTPCARGKGHNGRGATLGWRISPFRPQLDSYNVRSISEADLRGRDPDPTGGREASGMDRLQVI